MRKDESHLSQLGELATLKNFLGCYFHQDFWDDWGTVEEFLANYPDMSTPDERELVCQQIQVLIDRTDEQIEQFILKEAGGLWFETAAEYTTWVVKLYEAICPDCAHNSI
jgi:hypothetical protein